MYTTKYKCKKCGRAIEVFQELGQWGAACSNGTCRAAYEYLLFNTEQECLDSLKRNGGQVMPVNERLP